MAAWLPLLGNSVRFPGTASLRCDSEDGACNSLSFLHAAVLGDRDREAWSTSVLLWTLGAFRVSPILFSLRTGHGSWWMVVGGGVGHMSPAGLWQAFASDRRVLVLLFLT